MTDPVAAILAEPSLVAWLHAGTWRKGFDRGSLARSEGYANTDAIRITDAGHVPGESVSCEADVTGTGRKPYQTRMGLFSTGRSWAIEAECTCPVGLYCKHAAALLLLLLKALPGAPGLAVATSETVRLDPRLVDWLDRIGKNQTPRPTAAKLPTEEKRFLAYCIRPLHHVGWSNLWSFSLRVGTRQKSGAFIIGETAAQADPTRPPKYLRRDDFVPVSLYHQRRRLQAVWEEMRFTGDGWEDLLETAIATGRCITPAPDGVAWLTVREGPPLQVSATWRIQPSGNARPVLEFENGASRVILPTQPPRYLNPETGELGLLAGDAASGLLGSWLDGPEVPASQIIQITRRLQQISPELPVPSVVELVEHPPRPPMPHLVIRKRRFIRGWAELDIIHGALRFRYGGGPPLPLLSPGEKPVHYEIRDGKRHVQPRDAKAEAAAEKRLHRLGLLPLGQAMPRVTTDDLASRAVVSGEDDGLLMEGWLEFLYGPELAKLREEGWTVEIEPATGLLIHDAGGLFPEIETGSDHGIEWFRFDAKFEIDGRKVSLIPIIAEAIRRQLPSADSPDLPEHLLFPCADPADGSLRFPARRLMEMVDQVRHLFMGHGGEGPVKLDRLGAAGLAHSLSIETSQTLRALAELARRLSDIRSIPETPVPANVTATLRDYQTEGYRWLRFLAEHSLHGILADDMGLGKTVQTLAHLAAEAAKSPGRPSLVIAPTSVVPNWAAEAAKFTPHLNTLTLHGQDRGGAFQHIRGADLVITSYPLLNRDIEILRGQDWQVVVLDEAQYIKNSKSVVANNVCQLRAVNRLCLSGTPMENHLGELWSLMRFLMPGFLRDEKTFNNHFRKPIERDKSRDAQLALNRRVSPLILRRTKDQVATELPPKTELVHSIELNKKQTDLYESVRAAMDQRVREAISAQGLAKSHIIVLDALLKLRQICCHPRLLKMPAAQKAADSAKLGYLTDELLPTLLEEGRRILLFSSFTSMLEIIERYLEKQGIPFLVLTGKTKDRAALVERFQTGEIPIFLISLKAGGTGLNLTAADTVIHYDPWWNPAAENQATDRAHRIGQDKPVLVHKLVCTGTIEDRILELQKHKSALVEALLSEETSKLKIDTETLSHLLAPLG